MPERKFTGPIHPWAVEAAQRKEPQKWIEFVEPYGVDTQAYPTPFCVMRDLLDRWTMRRHSKTTAECDDGERLNRLFEVIGGYPMIGGGYRPLDFPAHPLAVPALTLSLYLDSIPVQECSSDWQSVRSHALLKNLNFKNMGGNAKTILQQMTGFLLSTVSEFERLHGEKERYPTTELCNEERRFLNVLHSSSNNRNAFWLLLFETKQNEDVSPESGESIRIRKRHTFLSKNQYEHIAEYNYHVFKFSRIQSWIRKWGQDIQLSMAQNFVIGPSIMIESIFVRLRSFILKEYGVGSICIDGGGRFSFLSKQNLSEVRATVRKFLLRSLLFDQDHPHPYNDLILEQMKQYVTTLEKKDNEKWIQIVKRLAKDENDLKLFSKTDGDKFPWARVIQYFIGEEQMEKWLPHYAVEADSDLNDGQEKTCNHRLQTNSEENEEYKSVDCAYCNFANQEKKPKQPSRTNCHLMCPMHWLMFKIADAAKIRNSSLSTQYGPQGGRWVDPVIDDVIALDGNCLGNIFKKGFEWEYKHPDLDEESSLDKMDREKSEELWQQGRKLYDTPHETMAPHLEQWNKEFKDVLDEKLLRRGQKVPKLARLESMLRLIRRSFDFNANWSLAFQKTILSQKRSLTPWVYAGDDIVLVNRMKLTDEEILHRLSDFHRQLQTNLPLCDISFAGGWAPRNQEAEATSIPDVLQGAFLNEKIAKHTWKKQISENDNFSGLLGERTCCSKCANLGQTWLNNQDVGGYCLSNEKGPQSLILKLEQPSTDDLEKEEPMRYRN